MALTPDQIQEAGGIVGAADTVRAAAATLRQRFPGLMATVVDPMDMRGETPAVQLDRRALYLMSTDGHCWTVTQEPAAASAVVLTQA